MSDQQVACVARNLASALNTFAHERRDEDRKNVSLLQTELCKVVRDEERETSEASPDQIQFTL
jgi:hypothetical protein